MIANGYITHINKDETDYFIFSELIKYETQALPDSVFKDVEKICELALSKHFQERLDENEDIEKNELLGDGGYWAEQILDRVIRLRK